jgi:hypothetical protein
VGVVWYESGEKRSGWRVWLRRAAHHFLPEDPVPAQSLARREAAAAGGARVASATGDERRARNGSSGGVDSSLDHVLRSAAESRSLS